MSKKSLTYLDLVRKLCNHAAIPAGFDSVDNATGHAALACSWIADAWQDIQQFDGGEWNFLWTRWNRKTSPPLNTDAADVVDLTDGNVAVSLANHGFEGGDKIIITGTQHYNGEYVLLPGTTANQIHVRAPYVKETFTGDEKVICRDYEFYNRDNIARFDRDYLSYASPGNSDVIPLSWMDYTDFSRSMVYEYDKPGAPSCFTVTPDKRLRLYPVPDKAYTLQCDAFRAPQVLEKDTDEPLLPMQYQMAIVWKGLVDYGGYEETSQVMIYAASRYHELWREILRCERYQRDPLVIHGDIGRY